LLLAGCNKRPPLEGKSVTELEKMLNSPDANLQAQGALGLSKRGREALPAIPALIAALKNPQVAVRQNAALALGAIGPEANAAVTALIDVLRDAEWMVRRQAAVALGDIGAKESMPALKKAAGDPNSAVQKAAKDALAKIQRG